MSNLKDYLSRLQELDEEEIVYSKPKENSTQIIPPELKKEKPTLKLNMRKKVVNEEEALFIQSKTSLDKKELWCSYYQKALKSRKQNSYVDSMRKGRFFITHDNKVMLLPNLDVSGDSREILSKNWLNNKTSKKNEKGE